MPGREGTPRLVLVNGLPASGKSTLARQWCDRQTPDRLPLCLDIDVLRSMIGGWHRTPEQSGLAARAVAVAGIARHLAGGGDVLVPQYLKRADFIEELQDVAAACHARFVETVLMVDPRVAARRFEDRASTPGDRDQWGALPSSMDHLAAEFEAFLRTRPQVHRIEDVTTLDRAIGLQA